LPLETALHYALGYVAYHHATEAPPQVLRFTVPPHWSADGRYLFEEFDIRP
jgi:hypothetical protein